MEKQIKIGLRKTNFAISTAVNTLQISFSLSISTACENILEFSVDSMTILSLNQRLCPCFRLALPLVTLEESL